MCDSVESMYVFRSVISAVGDQSFYPNFNVARVFKVSSVCWHSELAVNCY